MKNILKQRKNIYLMIGIVLLGLLALWGSQTTPQYGETVEEAYNEQEDLTLAGEGAMSYEEYWTAGEGSPVIIEGVVKEINPLTEGRTTILAADESGFYKIYEMECTSALYEELTIGREICIFGYRGDLDGQAVILDADIEIIGN